MMVYDDIYIWEGWGGKLRLGSGKCRLRIYDLSKEGPKQLTYLRPVVVIVSDMADSNATVRSCAGHIATCVIREFNIDPQRMLFIEFYPAKTYGENNEHLIPESYVVVEFTWHQGKALQPKWRNLTQSIQDTIQRLEQN